MDTLLFIFWFYRWPPILINVLVFWICEKEVVEINRCEKENMMRELFITKGTMANIFEP